MQPVNTYIPNLAERTDRKESIIGQYKSREEFSLHIVTPVPHEIPAYSLWKTFVECVRKEKDRGSEYFLFGEDDHIFTESYSPRFLEEAIDRARNHDADLLSGGMSWVDLPRQTACRNLFWVREFTGMQFTVIFKKAYEKILSAEFNAKVDVTDTFLSEILDRKLVVYPFVSLQKEFGYSDVTPGNSKGKRIESLFQKAEMTLRVLDKVTRHFDDINQKTFPKSMHYDDSEVFQFPTHVIHLPERNDRRKLLESQFAGRTEFRIDSIGAYRHPKAAIGLWNSICKAVSIAKSKGEDAVLICEDDHIFTTAYSKKSFFRHVCQAGFYGADMLSGGIGGFGNAVQVTDGLFWVDWLWCTQFIVIFRQAYDTVLHAKFDETDVADEFLSKILLNKMAIYPFVSEQLDLGYSDVTSANNEKGRITGHFQKSSARFKEFLTMGTDLLADDVREELPYENMHVMDYIGLNIGCGPRVKEGWLNVDLLPVQGACYLNAACPFPFSDESFRYVFSEHLFEHLSYESGKNMLREVYRVLRPGGIFRLALPTMEFLQRLMLHPEDEMSQRYASWSLRHYGRTVYEDFSGLPVPDTVPLVVNMFMRQWGHQVIYSHRILKAMLHKAGFASVCQVNVGESTIPVLQGLEEHGKEIPEWANEMETSVFEAVKQQD